MKKNLFAISLLVLFTSVFIYSCGDDKEEETPTPSETVAPAITFVTPISPAYNIGNLVKVNVIVTDNIALKSISVVAKNTTIDSVYLQKTFISSDTLYGITENFVCNITTLMADFMVTIEAEDAAGNKTQTVNTFHVMD